MNIKEAVSRAKQHIYDLYAEETVANVGLEEVEFDDQYNKWIVTIGFSRPWDEPRNALASLAQSPFPRRSYKIIRISDNKDNILSVKNREADV
jgi:hypothetical protein